MSMYLVSDDELNTIIRLRRQDVLHFLSDVETQNPQASFDELVTAAKNFFAAQSVQFDYLSDYTQEEIAYGLIEPEPEEDLDGAAVVAYEEEAENVDPFTDTEENEDADALTVVDDTVNLIEEPEEDADPEPAAEELVPEEPVAEETTEAAGDDDAEPTDGSGELAVQREDRSSKISLRALQRELRQIDKA